MTISALDEHVALIVIDLQAGIIATTPAHPTEDVLGRAERLVAAFRDAALPVVLVNVAGAAPGRTDSSGSTTAPPPGWTDLASGLNPEPEDHLITKHTWGAFAGTGLEEHLKGIGVSQVVVIGIATSAGVESTARAAYDAGFHVVLPIDAMTDRNPAAHEASVTHVFPRIAETGKAEEVLDLLARRPGPGNVT